MNHETKKAIIEIAEKLEVINNDLEDFLWREIEIHETLKEGSAKHARAEGVVVKLDEAVSALSNAIDAIETAVSYEGGSI
jgi:hypothetical protein